MPNDIVPTKVLVDTLVSVSPEQEALMEGLTDQQRDISKMKLRGLSQAAIARVMNLTPARISQEAAAIRKHYAMKGGLVDQNTVVGETLTVYEEVERRAWEVYSQDESKRLRALETVMAARGQHVKLLMDLGLVKRAAVEHVHDVAVSPIMQGLTLERKTDIIARIINVSPGEAPEPPMDMSEDDLIDVEDEDE